MKVGNGFNNALALLSKTKPVFSCLSCRSLHYQPNVGNLPEASSCVSASVRFGKVGDNSPWLQSWELYNRTVGTARELSLHFQPIPPASAGGIRINERSIHYERTKIQTTGINVVIPHLVRNLNECILNPVENYQKEECKSLPNTE